MEKAKKFDFKTPDKHGQTPDLTMIGSQHKHSGNRKVYEVEGFAWNGNTDEWMILQKRDGSLHEGSLIRLLLVDSGARRAGWTR